MEKTDLLLFTLILILLSLTFLPFVFNKYECKNNYENSQFNYIGGCKVEYEGKYIPLELYQKAFEQNININKNIINSN